MDYPRALDSSPEDRGLGVRDWTRTSYEHWLRVVERFRKLATPLSCIITRESGESVLSWSRDARNDRDKLQVNEIGHELVRFPCELHLENKQIFLFRAHLFFLSSKPYVMFRYPGFMAPLTNYIAYCHRNNQQLSSEIST